ncbi:hypothetical protein GCM10010985_46480 [Caballeronia grimmiae]|uniref:Uncharacterized protein n=1 Tax=Caballeronia grimmiae TaxID=1071679 RepID=A0ABQ1S0U6_9BURK|nr:hypothetical protein GCM10010985_46480 [Caballeronia grimmiae]
MPKCCFDTRIRFDELPQESAEPQEFRIENGPDTKRAAYFMTQRGSGPLNFGRGGDGALGVGKKRFAVACEEQSVRRACEEDNPEHLLKVLDLQADGRLREVQLGGGPREIAFAGDSEKSAQEDVVHA